MCNRATVLRAKKVACQHRCLSLTAAGIALVQTCTSGALDREAVQEGRRERGEPVTEVIDRSWMEEGSGRWERKTR